MARVKEGGKTKKKKTWFVLFITIFVTFLWLSQGEQN